VSARSKGGGSGAVRRRLREGSPLHRDRAGGPGAARRLLVGQGLPMAAERGSGPQTTAACAAGTPRWPRLAARLVLVRRGVRRRQCGPHRDRASGRRRPAPHDARRTPDHGDTTSTTTRRSPGSRRRSTGRASCDRHRGTARGPQGTQGAAGRAFDPETRRAATSRQTTRRGFTREREAQRALREALTSFEPAALPDRRAPGGLGWPPAEERRTGRPRGWPGSDPVAARGVPDLEAELGGGGGRRVRVFGTPDRIRTGVTTLKGWDPRPLDDGGGLGRDRACGRLPARRPTLGFVPPSR
jgi:hypothetical protein